MQNPARLHHYQPVGVGCRQVEIVEHYQQRPPLCVRQGYQQFQQVHLYLQVQKRGGFIKQKQIGFLGQHHGNPAALTLPATERIHRPVSKRRNVRHGHGLLNGGFVVPGPLAHQALIGETPKPYQLPDRQPIRGGGALWQYSELLRDGAGGLTMDVVAVKKHLASAGGQRSGQGSEQGGFARAIRSQQNGDTALAHREIHVRQHRSAVVSRAQ